MMDMTQSTCDCIVSANSAFTTADLWHSEFNGAFDDAGDIVFNQHDEVFVIPRERVPTMAAAVMNRF